LACPVIEMRDLSVTTTSLERGRLLELARRYPTLSSSFGLELKVAWLLESTGGPEGGERLRRPYYRLAQEPIVASYWPALQQAPMAPAAMLALASMLNGSEVEHRAGEMASTRGDGDDHLLYETIAQSRSWLADIARVDGLPGDPLNKALYRFARIVMAHPFTDANGRVARAALQGGLARHGLIAAPCLALAPSFYARAGDIRLALRQLSEEGCWADYFERIGDVLAEAAERVLSVADRKPGAGSGTLPSPTH
jgi:hypothetical protein